MVEASRGRLPDLRLFLSCGGAAGLEAELLDGTLKMANLLKGLGYPEKNLAVRIESWAEHNEEAWARMTPHWLRFLFGRPQMADHAPGTKKKCTCGVRSRRRCWRALRAQPARLRS